MKAITNIMLSVPHDIEAGKRIAKLLKVPEGTLIIDDGDFSLNKSDDGKWSVEYHAYKEIPGIVAKTILEELA